MIKANQEKVIENYIFAIMSMQLIRHKAYKLPTFKFFGTSMVQRSILSTDLNVRLTFEAFQSTSLVSVC